MKIDSAKENLRAMERQMRVKPPLPKWLLVLIYVVCFAIVGSVALLLVTRWC